MKIALSLILFALSVTSARAAVIDLGTARLSIDDRGVVRSVDFADGNRWPSSGRPAFCLETAGGSRWPKSVRLEGDRLRVEFDGGAVAVIRVTRDKSLAVFRLERLASAEPVRRVRWFAITTPEAAALDGGLNRVSAGGKSLAVMAAEPNVHAFYARFGSSQGDRPGCRHQVTRTTEARVGSAACCFQATADGRPGGWSEVGRELTPPANLASCKGLRAWVHGDGKGEMLKIQLGDGSGGARDYYQKIDFNGWRQVTIRRPSYDTLAPSRASRLSIYYNGLPTGQTVRCLLDRIEALVDGPAGEQALVLEDFEDLESPFWSPARVSLCVETLQEHGLRPAAFGVLACDDDQLLATVERFEKAACLPSPRLGGAWNKLSPWIKRSYFFLTNFRESEFDRALAIARRGGFHMILIDQGSWCKSTGHFPINTDRFPDGLEGLRRVVDRFHKAGFRVGLHFLGASIYPPDPYLTPSPDPRLVKGATATLAADVDAKADRLSTTAVPEGFPDEDGGYKGQGMVLQVGQELIFYGARSTRPPFGFEHCRRGYLGTRAAAHRRGEPVRHLVRSYGYHMFDLDTSLADEVSSNFAKVANACGIDMVYFDGSELLQGDHWYYNARLHKAYYDKLANKNLLLQASSASHYSWHMLARSASADGHGDLKGYLDERSPWFPTLARSGMPLDIGWYYGYDADCCFDMYEYVLQTTVGYDSSMSFQVSPSAADRHPFTGPILDLIRRYETLRLSGRVSEEMKARLRIDPILGGNKEPDQREKLRNRRREYRLLGEPGHEVFQRVAYEPWHDVSPLEPQTRWTVNVGPGPARVGMQIHARSGPWMASGAAYESPEAVVLETFDDLAPYSSRGKARRDVAAIGPGEGGATLPGVSHRLERVTGAREGRFAALYTAESKLASDGGWSAIGRQFSPPIDISRHKAIGLWLRGDEAGGRFKLQLRDGRGAADYYIANTYAGWRYHQLLRPERDPIDYRKVSSLTIYYNGLPAKKKVACAVDGVKALGAVDEPLLVDPFVEIGSRRWQWHGTLHVGEYLFFWPGEPVMRYAAGREPEQVADKAPEFTLPEGQETVRFGCRRWQAMSIRVRPSYQPDEKYKVP